MIKPKENGWILSIDQASNAAGVSLWYCGGFIEATTLYSNKSSDPIGRRLVAQIEQLDKWLEPRIDLDEIKVVLFEGVKSRLVLTTVGAFCCSRFLQNCRLHPRHSFVESSSWKSWAKKKGAFKADPDDEIKGIKSLVQTGWDIVKYPLETDDEADSVMIYQTWRDKE